MKIRNRIIFTVFLLQCLRLSGQYYDSGQERYTRWSLIETAHFKVLFPLAQQSAGKLYAGLLEQNYQLVGNTLGYHPRKFPVVLHSQTAIANGMVSWAPRRSSLYLVAPYDNFYLPWQQHLVLHESRHIVQVDGLHRWLTRGLSWFLGEQAEGVVVGLHVPLWFLEGDAVAYETGASNAGRGRVGSFNMELKTQVAEKGAYSYQKAMFGSYRDFVPDHYQLGYQIVSYGRLHYGTELWQSCLERTAKYPLTFRPFGKAIKKVTGQSEKQFYLTCMDSLKSELKERKSESVVLDRKKEYTNYIIPYRLANEDFIAYRENQSDIPAFVITQSDAKSDQVICHPGYLPVKTYSYQYPWLVWNEYRLTRWDQTNYSSIVAFNMQAHEKKIIARKVRAYGSHISPDKQLIASAEFSNELKWSITIRDFASGDMVKEHRFDSVQPTYPSWMPDSKSLAFIAISKSGKSIGIYRFNNDSIDYLVTNQQNDLSNLIAAGDFILVCADYNEKPAWFRYEISSQKWDVITETRNGTGAGSLQNDTLFFSNYTSDGFTIAMQNLDNSVKRRELKPVTTETSFSKMLSQQEQVVQFNRGDTNYVIQPYRRLPHLLNFHSWAPLAIKIDENEFGPGLTLMSQDVLSTSFLSMGYQYYYAEGRNNYFIDYKYKGFYLYLGLKGELDFYKLSKTDRNQVEHILPAFQQTYTSYLKVPFIFTSGSYQSGMTTEAGYEFIRYQRDGDATYQALDSSYHTLYYDLYFYALRRQAHRDLQPRLGIALYGSYMHHPTVGFANNQVVAESWVYLPGLFKNQHITLYGGYQEESDESNLFGNQIIYPKGCLALNNSRLLTAQGSYALPLAYPDWAWGSFWYIKRIKAKAFYGLMQAYYQGNISWIGSYGVEATADLHFFKFLVPFELGGTYARRLPQNDNYFGIIVRAKFSELY